MSAWLLSSCPRDLLLHCFEVSRWWSADVPWVARGTSHDDQAIIEQWHTSNPRDICKSPPSDFHIIYAGGSPCDHLQESRRRPNGERPFFLQPLHFFPPIIPKFLGWWPTSLQAEASRCPVGRRPTNELAQMSSDRRANFNCKLKCSRRQRNSPRWVLYRRIICQFSTDEYSSGTKTRQWITRGSILLYWDACIIHSAVIISVFATFIPVIGVLITL